MIYVTCRQTAKNRDQLRNPTLGNRVWATFTFLLRPRCRKAEYCDARVCLSASISPELRARPIFANFAHVTRGCGSVLRWRRCDTLCISGLWISHIRARRHVDTVAASDVTASSCAGSLQNSGQSRRPPMRRQPRTVGRRRSHSLLCGAVE